MADTLNFLFLDPGNSTRSIIAEALTNRLGAGRFRAFSAGSEPKGEVNPHALAVVAALGFADTDFRSKSWDEFAGPEAPPMSFVVTLCEDLANEAYPAWPGQPMAAVWDIPDPAEAEGSEAEIAVAYRDTARMLRNRIDLLLALPPDKLDTLAVRGIGRPATAA
jgi:arsenate reductase